MRGNVRAICCDAPCNCAGLLLFYGFRSRGELTHFDRRQKLAEQFPGAILAIVTLKALTPHEAKEVKKIVKAGMKQWKAERPSGPWPRRPEIPARTTQDPSVRGT